MCMNVLPVCIPVHHMSTESADVKGGQQISGTGVMMVVSHVGARNWIQAFCKSNKCSRPLGYLSSLRKANILIVAASWYTLESASTILLWLTFKSAVQMGDISVSLSDFSSPFVKFQK